VLHGGCVQEEILFLIKPECLASLLFCHKMNPHESIAIIGAEQLSSYSGYARSFKFAGDFKDDTKAMAVVDPGGAGKVEEDRKKSSGQERKRMCLANVIVAFDALVAFGENQVRKKKKEKKSPLCLLPTCLLSRMLVPFPLLYLSAAFFIICLGFSVDSVHPGQHAARNRENKCCSHVAPGLGKNPGKRLRLFKLCHWQLGLRCFRWEH
jgi:hypothetical protein